MQKAKERNIPVKKLPAIFLAIIFGSLILELRRQAVAIIKRMARIMVMLALTRWRLTICGFIYWLERRLRYPLWASQDQKIAELSIKARMKIENQWPWEIRIKE